MLDFVWLEPCDHIQVSYCSTYVNWNPLLPTVPHCYPYLWLAQHKVSLHPMISLYFLLRIIYGRKIIKKGSGSKKQTPEQHNEKIAAILLEQFSGFWIASWYFNSCLLRKALWLTAFILAWRPRSSSSTLWLVGRVWWTRPSKLQKQDTCRYEVQVQNGAVSPTRRLGGVEWRTWSPGTAHCMDQ